MGRLRFTTICSLDGYVADEAGDFSWAAPDEQMHGYVNDLERGIGTYLYGRRLYEVMRYWESASTGPDVEPVLREYAVLWQAADKVVYSTTLDAVDTARTRLERSFDLAAVRTLKDSTEHDVGIGGPGLAAAALHAGLVDDLHLLVVPEVVGAGTRALPPGLTLGLELRHQQRFDNGTVHLQYGVRAGTAR